MIYNMIGGGANQLNFKVVGSATEPSNPAENTIWVQTSISLTTVEFSDQRVSPSWAMPAGYCYISIDGGYWSSDYDARPAFDLVHKEKLIVYVEPKAAYLNTDGTASGWASVNAYIYKSGAWVDWMSEGALYYDGDELTAKTGGWKAVRGTIAKNADYFVVNKDSIVSTTNKISTVGYKTITVKALASGGTQWFGFGNTNNAFAVGQVGLPTGSVGEVSIDLTSIQGSYYPIFAADNSNTINVYRVVMRK